MKIRSTLLLCHVPDAVYSTTKEMMNKNNKIWKQEEEEEENMTREPV